MEVAMARMRGLIDGAGRMVVSVDLSVSPPRRWRSHWFRAGVPSSLPELTVEPATWQTALRNTAQTLRPTQRTHSSVEEYTIGQTIPQRVEEERSSAHACVSVAYAP
eukprot:7389434-Prymnesium_polylepis.2